MCAVFLSVSANASAQRDARQADKKVISNDSLEVKKAKGSERNVMLNASDATKPREIQIGLPSEDVNVYENGLPAVYSSAVHKLQYHWRSDASLGEVGLMTSPNIKYIDNQLVTVIKIQMICKCKYKTI